MNKIPFLVIITDSLVLFNAFKFSSLYLNIIFQIQALSDRQQA